MTAPLGAAPPDTRCCDPTNLSAMLAFHILQPNMGKSSWRSLAAHPTLWVLPAASTEHNKQRMVHKESPAPPWQPKRTAQSSAARIEKWKLGYKIKAGSPSKQHPGFTIDFILFAVESHNSPTGLQDESCLFFSS